MRKAADVVIIGGGALGTSILYHLTKVGLSSVVLLEKGALCSGSSGDSAAMVRQHYSNEVSIRLVKKSLDIFKEFPEEFNGINVFTSTGWLFLCPPEASAVFKQNMIQLKSLGVRTWEIPLNEITDFIPGLNLEGIGCVAFEPESGYANPHNMTEAFAAKAKEKGADVYINTPAVNIRLTNGHVSGVLTEKGEISTRVIVNAAGPWAKTVGNWAGLSLPLEISREQDVIIHPPDSAPPLRYVVSSMVDRTYFRPETGGSILVGTGHPKENEPADPNEYSRKVDRDFIIDVTRRLIHRFPALEGGEFRMGWAGLYTITPDWNMILGRAPDVEGFYLAVGGSGHSFKLAPAAGLCLAELITGGKVETVDITPLRATRFEEEEPLISTYGGNRG